MTNTTAGGLTPEVDASTRVNEALQADPETAGAVIDVSVEGTTATLVGEVGSAAVKAAAIRVAKSVAGVIVVVDELSVRGTAGDSGLPGAGLVAAPLTLGSSSGGSGGGGAVLGLALNRGSDHDEASRDRPADDTEAQGL